MSFDGSEAELVDIEAQRAGDSPAAGASRGRGQGDGPAFSPWRSVQQAACAKAESRNAPPARLALRRHATRVYLSSLL